VKTPQVFKTSILKQGSKTFIGLPFNPDEVWGAKPRQQISGSINNCKVRGQLIRQGDQFILVLGAAWRRDNQLEAGAEVEVVLAPEGPQMDDLPPDIIRALEEEPLALAFFESLATFYRKAYLKWISRARRPEIRSARIAEMVSLLKAGVRQRQS